MVRFFPFLSLSLFLSWIWLIVVHHRKFEFHLGLTYLSVVRVIASQSLIISITYFHSMCIEISTFFFYLYLRFAILFDEIHRWRTNHSSKDFFFSLSLSYLSLLHAHTHVTRMRISIEIQTNRCRFISISNRSRDFCASYKPMAQSQHHFADETENANVTIKRKKKKKKTTQNETRILSTRNDAHEVS